MPSGRREVLAGRLPNTVAHHHRTRARERELGVNHWDESGPVVRPALALRGRRAAARVPRRLHGAEPGRRLPAVSRATARGLRGSRRAGCSSARSTARDLGRLGAAARPGRRLDRPRRARRSCSRVVPDRSLDGPRRLLSAGLYTGVAYTEPLGVTFAISPGHGEIIEIPIQTFEGNATTLLFECIPGGDLEVLASTPYARRSRGVRAPRARQAARRTSRPSSSASTRRASA